MKRLSQQHKHGFTLIEILIVVIILGVLAAIVIPQYSSYSDESKVNSFVTCVKNIAKIADYHYTRSGEYFEDSGSGLMPTNLDTYIQASKWTHGTPIGGVWDYEQDDLGGYKSAFGVHFDGSGHTRDDTYMQEVDAAFDDGDLTAGCFRKIADGRYYYIVAVN